MCATAVFAVVALRHTISGASGFFSEFDVNETEVVASPITSDDRFGLESGERLVDGPLGEASPIEELIPTGGAPSVFEDVDDVARTRREIGIGIGTEVDVVIVAIVGGARVHVHGVRFVSRAAAGRTVANTAPSGRSTRSITWIRRGPPVPNRRTVTAGTVRYRLVGAITPDRVANRKGPPTRVTIGGSLRLLNVTDP